MSAAITEFVARYALTGEGDWAATRDRWREIALDAWLAAAQERGLEVEVLEILDGPVPNDVAIVRADGADYVLVHPGRAPEVQARPR